MMRLFSIFLMLLVASLIGVANFLVMALIYVMVRFVVFMMRMIALSIEYLLRFLGLWS